MPKKAMTREDIENLIKEMGLSIEGTLSFTECAMIHSKMFECSLEESKEVILKASLEGELEPMHEDGSYVDKEELIGFTKDSVEGGVN